MGRGHGAKPSSKAQDLGGKHRSNNEGRKPQKPQKRSAKITPPVRMTTYTRPPPTWPAILPFLSTVHNDNSLTPSQHEMFHPMNIPEPDTAYTIPSQCVFSPTSNPLITISPVTSPSHPAYPQYGLFAAKTLPPGTHILDYTGLLHSCPLPSCEKSDYDLAFLDRDAALAIDGAKMGNEARFINDYHGICERPNAVFEEYFVRVKEVKGRGKGREVWEARMGVWVSPVGMGIVKGEEICLSYGKGYWRARMGQQEAEVEAGSVEGEADPAKRLECVRISDGKD